VYILFCYAYGPPLKVSKGADYSLAAQPRTGARRPGRPAARQEERSSPPVLPRSFCRLPSQGSSRERGPQQLATRRRRAGRASDPDRRAKHQGCLSFVVGG
jgi:hypothetical protein